MADAWRQRRLEHIYAQMSMKQALTGIIECKQQSKKR